MSNSNTPFFGLDPLFGPSGGIVTGKYNTDANLQHIINSIGVQSTGKIIIGGNVGYDNSSYGIARYSINGVLDASFGTNGIICSNFSNSTISNIVSIAIQSDDYIVVGGHCGSYPDVSYGLARYTANGSLDASFGNNGKVVAHYLLTNSKNSYIRNVSIQPDGKIVISGGCANKSPTNLLAIARYNTNGTLDSSFGTGGVMTDQTGYQCTYHVLKPNGSIVLWGASTDSKLFGYTASGQVDTTFGSGTTGKTLAFGTNDIPKTILCQSNGSIIAIAETRLTKFKSTGVIDLSFGTNGVISVSDVYSGVILLDDSIITCGKNGNNFAITKYNPNGTIDTKFSSTGNGSIYSGNPGMTLSAYSVFANSSQIIIGGIDSSSKSYSLTRYLGPYPCFKSGTKILTTRGYIEIDQLKKGDLVKTRLNGYVPIHIIGSRKIAHTADNSSRSPTQLYMYSTRKIPELFADLVVTGCHSVLVDEYSNAAEKQRAIDVNGDTYITEDQYRLPACADNRASVYKTAGNYTIYHFALENEDTNVNYGVYANGLLVESCSIYDIQTRLG